MHHLIKGGRVRAIIIMNPHNPLGNIYQKEELSELCEWAMKWAKLHYLSTFYDSRKDLFLIFDEILSEIIYSDDEKTSFHSILDLLHLLSKPELIVWMSSLSKVKANTYKYNFEYVSQWKQ